jgi:hypothetical protein
MSHLRLIASNRQYIQSEPGEHAIYISIYLPSEIWFCAPLKGIEAPSE